LFGLRTLLLDIIILRQHCILTKAGDNITLYSNLTGLIGRKQANADPAQIDAALDRAIFVAFLRACAVVWARSLRHRKSTSVSTERRQGLFDFWRRRMWGRVGARCQATSNFV